MKIIKLVTVLINEPPADAEGRHKLETEIDQLVWRSFGIEEF
jgi:hypothetical protein